MKKPNNTSLEVLLVRFSELLLLRNSPKLTETFTHETHTHKIHVGSELELHNDRCTDQTQRIPLELLERCDPLSIPLDDPSSEPSGWSSSEQTE